MVPADELPQLFSRRAVGGLAVVASGAFALLLAVYVIRDAYLTGPALMFPGSTAWTDRENEKEMARMAAELLQEGRTASELQPAQAEMAFRRALPLWQKLSNAKPTKPEHQCTLAAVLHNLGLALDRQNRLDEAEEVYRSALVAYNRLEVIDPGHQHHESDRATVERRLQQAARFRLTKLMSEDASEERELQRLVLAGQPREAVAVSGQALERYERRADDVSDRALFAYVLATKQNRVAWLLVVCPDSQVRDSARAVALAKEAVTHSSRSGMYWTTLGAAHYRAGNWQESQAALEEAIQLRGGGSGLWYFLAMTCQRLGRPAEAKQWLDRAVRWSEQPPPAATDNPLLKQRREVLREEAEFLRREAEELILGKAPTSHQ
jgi:tetratricopeptide (TPR) repeat protein